MVDPSNPPEGTPADRERFAGLTVEDFRRLATAEGLSPNERAGFPDAFRSGRDDAILRDMRTKVPALGQRARTIVDIGTGCSDLAVSLVADCEAHRHRIVLVDVPEVLAHHRPRPGLLPIPGSFPEVADAVRAAVGPQGADGVIAYSVLQYTGSEMADFVIAAATLLSPGGRCLIGDIPNSDMRERFVNSDRGREYASRVWGCEEPQPMTRKTDDEPTDARLFAVLSTLRQSGFHAWVTPQDRALPMANRREDLLIERP